MISGTALTLLLLSQAPPAGGGPSLGARTGALVSRWLQHPGPPALHCEGNKVLLDEVYIAVADLGPEDRADEETAEKVRDRLLGFLLRAGYELAQVSVTPEGHGFRVELDEGQLEKVVFRGRLTVQTVGFKLALVLPHDVYNRPALEREMAELARKLDIDGAWYRLVPTEEVEHVGPQLEELPEIQGVDLVRPRHNWELHIFFAEKEWDTGVGVDLRTGYADGLELGLNYQGEDLLFAHDRWRAAASGGAGLRNRIHDGQLYPAFSRASAELRWFTPPLFGRLRPLVWLGAEGIARQRVDLNIENYFNVRADASVHLDLELAKYMHLSFGGGFRWRRLFGARAAQGRVIPPLVTDTERERTFALLRTELVFDGSQDRWDRRHELVAEVRHFFALDDPQYGEARAHWQRVLAFGWHDLWIRARGAFLWGEVAYHDEELVSGYHLRAVFAHEWARKVASAGAEFRFSITRDLYKLSIFHDAAVWGRVDRQTGQETLVVGNSFGPGFHALIEGMLQLDLYLSFGFTSDRRFDAGFAALLLKVF